MDKVTRAALLAMQRLQHLQLVNDFDPSRPGSRPTDEQQKIINHWIHDAHKIYAILGGNRSGKSQISRRILAWMLREDAEGPWKRPSHWKGKLIIVFVGKSHKQMSADMMVKFEQFFNPGELRVVKQAGSSLFSAECLSNGNTIYFIPHENTEQCRERAQAFGAHAVFLDELPRGPNALKLVEELKARTTDTKGYMFMSFTPKSVNMGIKKWVDSLQPPLGRKYTLRFLDNPGVDDEAKQLRLQEIATHTAAYQKTLLEGDWMQGEALVFNPPECTFTAPIGYSPAWRHVVSIDPGLDSACGIVLFAENPMDSKWYLIRTEKHWGLKDVDASVRVAQQTAEGLNVVRFVYDSASSWWAYQAAKMGVKNIVCPADKNRRKDEMISNMQRRLGADVFVSPWCSELQDELEECAWSPTTEGKIANAKTYHLLDACRYGIDCLPEPARGREAPLPYAAQLRKEHESWKAQERAKKAAQAGSGVARPVMRGTPTVRRKLIW